MQQTRDNHRRLVEETRQHRSEVETLRAERQRLETALTESQAQIARLQKTQDVGNHSHHHQRLSNVATSSSPSSASSASSSYMDESQERIELAPRRLVTVGPIHASPSPRPIIFSSTLVLVIIPSPPPALNIYLPPLSLNCRCSPESCKLRVTWGADTSLNAHFLAVIPTLNN